MEEEMKCKIIMLLLVIALLFSFNCCKESREIIFESRIIKIDYSPARFGSTKAWTLWFENGETVVTYYGSTYGTGGMYQVYKKKGYGDNLFVRRK
jgi:hypothetical protein